MKKTVSDFELFRYQLLPIDRYVQGDLLAGLKSVEDLLAQKNQIFAEALSQVDDFSSGNIQTITKRLFSKNDFFLYRLAANRSIHRETRQFTDEYLDNWPSLYIAVWNDPNVQLIAVQKRPAAFQQTDTVVKLIVNSIEKSMAHHQLRVHVEPLFETHEFWDIIERHQGRVQRLEFEFITPNMANISKTLSANLREFAKSTNSATNELAIQSDPDSSLKITKQNEDINGLVNYSADGGGNISVRLAGMKKTIETSKTKKKVHIDDVTLEGNPDQVAHALKELMS